MMANELQELNFPISEAGAGDSGRQWFKV